MGAHSVHSSDSALPELFSNNFCSDKSTAQGTSNSSSQSRPSQLAKHTQKKGMYKQASRPASDIRIKSSTIKQHTTYLMNNSTDNREAPAQRRALRRRRAGAVSTAAVYAPSLAAQRGHCLLAGRQRLSGGVQARRDMRNVRYRPRAARGGPQEDEKRVCAWGREEGVCKVR